MYHIVKENSKPQIPLHNCAIVSNNFEIFHDQAMCLLCQFSTKFKVYNWVFLLSKKRGKIKYTLLVVYKLDGYTYTLIVEFNFSRVSVRKHPF